uniref:Highly acidic protein n=1 Tax=Meloidogyne hapla TaxID=6305 RepID=A0A1I8C1Q0_MELHA
MDSDNSDNEDEFTVDELEQLEQMRNALLAELHGDEDQEEDQICDEGNAEEEMNGFPNNNEENNFNSDNANISEDIHQNEHSFAGVIQDEDDEDSNSEEEFDQEEISKHIDNLLEEPIKDSAKTTPKHLSKRFKRVAVL